jgi:anhydro-N-acetylmuramic acid kinase
MFLSNQPVYRVIGLMSGTSLDGLDIAYCTFDHSGNSWKYSIDVAETLPHSAEWKERLTMAMKGSATELTILDTEFGWYTGRLVRDFIHRHRIHPEFIASHGHTIFHQPERGITLQIGKGQAIAAATGLPVVFDFRTLDVALGGQGAPLVPIGDRLLFSEYGFCLNIGGIANISCERNGERIAFDICPANMILNRIARREGLEYDAGGELARKGKVWPDMVEKLNNLPFYSLAPPKSLGREWVEQHIFPITDDPAISACDLLATFCEHIAFQVGRSAAGGNAPTIMITGGGALNAFLAERISTHTSNQVILPDLSVIHFKEALIFAFLGLLRMRGEVNTLASVTGALRDSSGGVIVWPDIPVEDQKR